MLVFAASSIALAVTGYGVSAWPREPYLFAVIGNSGEYPGQQREAGVGGKVMRLSWHDFYSSEGEVNTPFVEKKKAEIQALHDGGFEVIASLNYHDTPAWVHENHANSYYVDQFGGSWTGTNFANGRPADNGDANLVFNPQLRALVDSYLKDVFSELGTDFHAVRVGGGRYGEVSYPSSTFEGRSNLYWAYDENAQRSAQEAGIAGWKPGSPSPNGEAEKFLNWYQGSLIDYQSWQIEAVRRAGYGGRIMVLYPSWGVRPGEQERAIGDDLSGFTRAEKSGQIPMGRDFARQVAAIGDSDAVVTTTYLDAPASADDNQHPYRWSPVKYLHSLVEDNPVRPGMYGENTGGGSFEDMLIAASQMQRYGLIGMAWYDEEQLFSGDHATLAEYGRVIETYRGCGG